MVGRRSLEEATTIYLELTIGSILIGFGGASLLHLALLGSHIALFWVVAVVAFNDTGAYFFGKLMGRNKLSIHISPGKSIEGGLGGLILGIIAGIFIGNIYPESLGTSSNVHFAILAFFVGVFGQSFDLTKSFVKRIAGVKDSGNLLPGHGGFLDRLDGVLGGALALHIVLEILGVSIFQ
jgi:phosphatidate cytidylyltransferase